MVKGIVQVFAVLCYDGGLCGQRMFYDSGKRGGGGVSFTPMTWDAALCVAYYEQGYRAAQTLPAHKIRSLEDVACREGYCDCFREGYAQGVAERENTQHDNADATRALREAYCGLA